VLPSDKCAQKVISGVLTYQDSVIVDHNLLKLQLNVINLTDRLVLKEEDSWFRFVVA